MLRLFFLAALPALAHDMWIEPSTFRPAPGSIVALKLRVGQQLLGDALPYTAALVKEFTVADADGRRAVLGREGADPAGLLRTAASGTAVVLYASHASRVEQPSAKFENYLNEEGLEAINAERTRRGEASSPGREEFSRCAKTLLAISAVPTDHRMGCKLELVAEGHPTQDAALPVQLNYDGKPLAGALVVAMNRAHPSNTQRLRTDRNGRATFQLGGGGLWMVKAVHMVRAAIGQDVDWSSFWASLTFERPAAQTTAGGH